MGWRRWRRGGEAGERGASALEFALIVPVLLLLFLGAVDFGQAIVLSNMASEAARDGARKGIVTVTRHPDGTGAPTVTTAQRDAIVAAARDKAGPWGDRFEVTVVPGYDSGSGGGQWVRVVVRGSYEPVTPRLLGINSVSVGAASKLYLP